MQLLVYSVVLIWTMNAADGTGKTVALSQPDDSARILQGFGIVDDPTPTSKPTLPPIFAPVASKPSLPSIFAPVISKPSLPPIFAPVAAPVNPRPVSIPIAKPVAAPLTAPTLGFGSGGGNVQPTVMPKTASTTTPTSTSSDVEGPTSIPTTGSGVVLLDEPTSAPTISPILVVQSSPPVASSWLSFVVTYTCEMYTIAKDPLNVNEILRTVHGDIRKSLHRLIKQQNVSIVIELLESELLGTQ